MNDIACHVVQVHQALLPFLIGLGAGLLNGISKTAQANKQRQLAAQTQLYSPWTHMSAQPVQEANLVGDTLSGGLAGLMYGQLNPSAAAAGSAGSQGATAGLSAGMGAGSQGATAGLSAGMGGLDPALAEANPTDVTPDQTSLNSLQAAAKQKPLLFNPWGQPGSVSSNPFARFNS